MPVARTHAIALVGVEGHAVEIEADIQNGLPGLLLVGLPDTALREARDRIRAAIVNSREQWPQRRITVGLSPASLPKRGSGFDLGIAVAILSAANAVPAASVDGIAFLGELRPHFLSSSAITINDSVRVNATLCMCCSAAVDFVASAPPVAETTAGELEMF